MRRTLLPLFAAVIMVVTIITGGSTMSESIHYYKGVNIGDVHPYWDAKSETWYMYYLKSDGSFASSLLLSKDMLNWEQKELTSRGALAAYFVLGVQQAADGAYYSWYGSDMSMSSSKSEDLLHWTNPGSEYSIPMGYQTFISMRDPYVFFDEDVGVWRMICTAYRTNQLQGRGLGMKCALGIASTTGNTPTSWNAVDTALIEFPKGLEGEPECPQMMKINNRWYIFASMARRHENYVGRLSYFIGDEDKGIFEQDWNAKKEHFLTSEDLCAAQLSEGSDGIYLWGWIASNWNGGSWGGHLSLPLKINQNSDGTLASELPAQISKKIRGKMITSGMNTVYGNFTRWDAMIHFSVETGQRANIHCANGVIVLDDKNGIFAVAQNELLTHVSYEMDPGRLEGKHMLRIIAEGNILEVFLDDKWALSARMQTDVKCNCIFLENVADSEIEVYELN